MTDEQTAAPWAPLSRRRAGLGPDTTLQEGIPRHLNQPLHKWVSSCGEIVAQNFEYPWGRLARTEAWEQEILLHLGQASSLASMTGPAEDRLDAIDAILHFTPAWRDPVHSILDVNPAWREHVEQLERILATGRSAWRVATPAGRLERRLDDTVTAAATTAVRDAGAEAADHLAAAWQAAYGRHPDPDKSYAEAVKAVEALACPLVLPNKTTQGNAILSNVIGDLNSSGGGKWELLLTDTQDRPVAVEPLVTMMRLLMQGHRSRHSGGPNTRRQSQAEAEAAAHLAATLVQWLSSGVLRRKP